MKFKLNPLTGEFDYTSESANKQKLNPLTGEFNLVEGDGPFSQIFNPLTGTFNLGTRGGGGIIAEVTGNGYINLTNAVAHRLMELKAYGGTEQRNLPSEYTQVEYLESSGTQYIDTGIVLKSKATVTTVGQFLSITSPSNAPISMWGFMGRSTFPRWGCSVYNNQWLMDLNTTSNQVAADTAKHTFVNETDGTTTYNGFVDGVSIYVHAMELNQAPSYQANTLSAYIFARNSAGTAGNFSSSRIYSFNIVQDNVEVINLIPAKRNSDNVLGMYDTVTGNFLTNAGTGTFTAGATAVPTPDTPMDIWCNNGIVKVSPNLFNKDMPGVLVNGFPNASGARNSSGNFRSILYKLVEGKTYTITRKTSTPTSSAMRVIAYSTNSLSTANADVLYIGTSAVMEATITVPSGYPYILTYVKHSSDEISDEDLLNGFQIELGETATQYMPYGQIYTDGTVETINATGKNLFDKDATWGMWYRATGGVISTAAPNRTVVIRCLPNTTYYYKHCTYVGGLRAFYTEEENWDIGSPCSPMSGVITGDANAVYSITTSANAKWLFVNFGRNDSSITATFEEQASDYMLSTEELTSDTPYEPYFNGGTATAEMLLKIGNYVDEQEILSGNITRKVGIYVFNGTETFGTLTNNVYYVDNLAENAYKGEDAPACICTHYNGISATIGVSSMEDKTIKVGYKTGSATVMNRLYIRDVSFESADDLKDFVAAQYNAGTPIIVVYSLDTPTTESVAGQPMNIQAGTNIIEITQASIDNLPLYAKYLSTNNS